MLVFTSQYPHFEGPNHPIAKFDESMSNCDQVTMAPFYYKKMAEVMQRASVSFFREF